MEQERGGTDTTIRTQMNRLTETALDVVLVEAATLEGGYRTEITSELEVSDVAQVTTPPPPPFLPPGLTEIVGLWSELLGRR